MGSHRVDPAPLCTRACPGPRSPAGVAGSQAPRARPPRAGPCAAARARACPRDGWQRSRLLSGLIDEVCADSRCVTLGGRRRAPGGRRAQTQRRSGSAPGRQPPPLRCAPARLRGGGGGRGSASRAWRPRSSPASSLRLPGFPSGRRRSVVQSPRLSCRDPSPSPHRARSSALTRVAQGSAGVRGRGDSPRSPRKPVPCPSDGAVPLRRDSAAAARSIKGGPVETENSPFHRNHSRQA